MTEVRNPAWMPSQATAASKESAAGGLAASAEMRASQPRSRSDAGEPVERWENEGGALFRGGGERQYGRRVEADGTWTVYHVFTGIPAFFNGRLASGLSRGEATFGMIWLNRRNEQDRWSHSRIRRESAVRS